MDVGNGVRAIGPILLLASLHLLAAEAQADPLYTVIDLGTGSPTFGTHSDGQRTVTGSNGLTLAFDTSQVGTPRQGINTSQGIPNVVAPPVGNPDTYGNPAYAYSHSTVMAINGQGLAAGLDDWGVSGHLFNTEAFAIQQQANGSWGTPIALWSGEASFGGSGTGVGILGISANGQVLGIGYNMGGQLPYYSGPSSGYGLFVYDSKSGSFTDLSNVVNSTLKQTETGWTGWYLNSPIGQIDNQGRILLSQEATQGFSGPAHTLLLVPQGASTDPVPAPEPATWAIFATLIGGWLARKRLRYGVRRD
jgi:hypothetical protein